MKKSEIEKRIEDLENMIADLEKDIENFEIDPYDFEDEYCEMLDCEGPVNVCGYQYDPSHILKEIDPTAYRCGLIDYADSIDIDDIDEYRELNDKLEELVEEHNSLIDELNELEEEE